jgi:hypothetical protein
LGALADKIRTAVGQGQYIFSLHANQMLRKRRIVAWQIVEGLDRATLIREIPNALPNSTAEFDQQLADGTFVKAVWAWISHIGIAKLVTVHFFDR